MAFRRARLGVTALFVAALTVMPGVARASGVVRTVCASGCDFTSINMAVNHSNADDFIVAAIAALTLPASCATVGAFQEK